MSALNTTAARDNIHYAAGIRDAAADAAEWPALGAAHWAAEARVARYQARQKNWRCPADRRYLLGLARGYRGLSHA